VPVSDDDRGGQNKPKAVAGGTLGFFGASLQTKPTVLGSRSGGAALTSLIDVLNALGQMSDGTIA
jgi:hypothetical protein